MRPLLLPGAHVLRRSRGQAQVGLRPENAVLIDLGDEPLPDLTRLSGEHPAAAALDRAGLLLDDRELRPALVGEGGAASADPRRRACAAAVARRAPRPLAEVLTDRRTTRVAVTALGGALSRQVADDLGALLGRAGMRVAPAPPGDLLVLVAVGEPSRDRLDGWVREDVPHLVVRLVEGAAVVGPLVVPGRSACLRCLDAHHADDDPVWPLLVEQYARAASRDRADGVPEPLDPAVATVAVGWAAREVAAYVEGGCPLTRDATLTIPEGAGPPEVRAWRAHPRCGCTWG